jgi:hypothetical protein
VGDGEGGLVDGGGGGVGGVGDVVGVLQVFLVLLAMVSARFCDVSYQLILETHRVLSKEAFVNAVHSLQRQRWEIERVF